MKRLILVLLVLAGCAVAPTVYRPGAVIDQILVFRAGHAGLTLGNCEAFGKDGKCSQFVVHEYSLDDVNTRDLFRLAHFICMIGDKRYLIDPARPGIFHREYIYKKFLGIVVSKTPIDDFIPQTDADKLSKLGTQCFSEDKYDSQEIL